MYKNPRQMMSQNTSGHAADPKAWWKDWGDRIGARNAHNAEFEQKMGMSGDSLREMYGFDRNKLNEMRRQRAMQNGSQLGIIDPTTGQGDINRMYGYGRPQAMPQPQATRRKPLMNGYQGPNTFNRQPLSWSNNRPNQQTPPPMQAQQPQPETAGGSPSQGGNRSALARAMMNAWGR